MNPVWRELTLLQHSAGGQKVNLDINAVLPYISGVRMPDLMLEVSASVLAASIKRAVRAARASLFTAWSPSPVVYVETWHTRNITPTSIAIRL